MIHRDWMLNSPQGQTLLSSRDVNRAPLLDATASTEHLITTVKHGGGEVMVWAWPKLVQQQPNFVFSKPTKYIFLKSAKKKNRDVTMLWSPLMKTKLTISDFLKVNSKQI